VLAPYAQARVPRAFGDLATSVPPYLALMAAMYLSLRVSYALTLTLAVPTSAFALRTFVIFHDCTHGSFLPSRRANQWVVRVLGLVVFSPFVSWRHDHLVHHATSGDLDRRGGGDVLTLTVAEYRSGSWRARVGYRLFRNPLVSPDILGASSGAALGAVLGIYFSLGVIGIEALAFVGGIIAVAAVYVIGSLLQSRDPILVLVLAGVVVGSLAGAAISLVVGGIGIMNIMLSTVTSRIREIGIRKAIGATNREIRFQFLAEAILISLIGGFAGIVIGLALPYSVRFLTEYRIPISGWSALIAIAVSSVVGIIFGTVPATRAAQLDPVESLRYE